MSQTGFWIIGALGQDVLDALRERVDASSFEALPSGLDVGWWEAMDEVDVVELADLRYGAARPTDPAAVFHEGLRGLRPDPDVLDACVAAIGEATEAEDRVLVAVRKGDPVAAFRCGSRVVRARLAGGCWG